MSDTHFNQAHLDELFAQLPADVVQALQEGDMAALQTAILALPSAEQHQAMQTLHAIQMQTLKSMAPEQLFAQLPRKVFDALEAQDEQKMQAEYEKLPKDEQMRVVQILQILNEMDEQ